MNKGKRKQHWEMSKLSNLYIETPESIVPSPNNKMIPRTQNMCLKQEGILKASFNRE